MIVPILLCGGSGTRLWPLSRKSYPKQFSALIGAESLFQASARRLDGPDFTAPVVVTASDFRFIVTEQLAAVGIDPGSILIEPAPRNTAPAVLAAVIHVAATDPKALVLIAPSDHAIPNPEAFRAAMRQGIPAAEAGQIVTFGITPTRAETGYGWLELAGEAGAAAIPLRRFVEKPDAARAAEMLEAGSYLWNAGIFLMRADSALAAFRQHASGLIEPVSRAVAQARSDIGFLRLDPAAWAEAPEVSLDYAVMEPAANLMVVPFAAGWSDLGGWDAVWMEMGPNEVGVATSGPATAIDCTDTLLRSESEGLELVGIGLKDIIVVAMPDAVLVADRSRSGA